VGRRPRLQGPADPAWDARLFDLATAADSQDYCDDIRGTLAEHGLQVSELTTHILGQLVAVHPAYDELCDGFAPEALRGNPQARSEWAQQQLHLAARASRRWACRTWAPSPARSPGPTCSRSRSARRA
jgi:sugar phosphate isomerase/epimerase